MSKPVVAIVGRPNVGKSTLFNALAGEKISIVKDTPGVTRDPVEGTAFIDGKPVHLVDTGGFKLDRIQGSREAEMDELVVEKSLATIKNADLILLLLEAGKITGEDEEFIHILRPYWNKVIVAVNKCEGGFGQDLTAAEGVGRRQGVDNFTAQPGGHWYVGFHNSQIHRLPIGYAVNSLFVPIYLCSK